MIADTPRITLSQCHFGGVASSLMRADTDRDYQRTHRISLSRSDPNEK